MRYIYTNNRLMERFMQLLDASNPRDRIYVYRLENNQPIRPAIYVGVPFSGLEDYLRNKYGTCEFQIMIRRGERMLLAGHIAVEAAPGQKTSLSSAARD